jgi:hypothetical protein
VTGGLSALSGFEHQGDNRVGVVAPNRVVGDPVGTDEAALYAPVNQDKPFAAAVLHALGEHDAAAGRGAVAGVDVDVLGVQARGAVVAIAPVAERWDARSAVLTREALVLGCPADGSASGSKK